MKASIYGTVTTGKSFFAQLIKNRGCKVLDTDILFYTLFGYQLVPQELDDYPIKVAALKVVVNVLSGFYDIVLTSVPDMFPKFDYVFVRSKADALVELTQSVQVEGMIDESSKLFDEAFLDETGSPVTNLLPSAGKTYILVSGVYIGDVLTLMNAEDGGGTLVSDQFIKPVTVSKVE